ncbi:hypothetical protein BDV11DRAFT_169311 [Aspergillus similis]
MMIRIEIEELHRTNDGDDDLLGHYVNYIEELVSTELGNLMSFTDDPRNKYFGCTWNVNGVRFTTQTCPCPEIQLAH